MKSRQQRQRRVTTTTRKSCRQCRQQRKTWQWRQQFAQFKRHAHVILALRRLFQTVGRWEGETRAAASPHAALLIKSPPLRTETRHSFGRRGNSWNLLSLRKLLWALCQSCVPARNRLDFFNPGVMAQSCDRLQLPSDGFESCENRSCLVSSCRLISLRKACASATVVSHFTKIKHYFLCRKKN